MPEILDQYTRATAAVTFIRSHTETRPNVGIVLGSGLGEFGARVERSTTISYVDIPHFPQSTVVGHSGNLIVGELSGKSVAVMQGRVHAYEGYSAAEITFPTRVLGLLGCRTLIVTNAAGGINAAFKAGELVAIRDHINLTSINAASGPNEPRFGMAPGSGQRFFDMGSAYSPALLKLAKGEASRQGVQLRDGVYLAVFGPSFETPSEIRAFRTLGADMVGMSTVHEVIVARHMGMEVLGLSLITNAAAGVTDETIDHEEVMEIGRKTGERFAGLVEALVPQLGADR